MTFDTSSANAQLNKPLSTNNVIDTISAPLILNKSLDIRNSATVAVTTDNSSSLKIIGGITAGTVGTKTISNLGSGDAGVWLTTGVIGDGSGGVAVTQDSPTSELYLGGANTFTGGLVVKNGVVGSIGTVTTVFGASTAANSITLGDATTGAGGATLVGGVTYANPITVASGGSGRRTLGSRPTTSAPTFNGAITLNTDLWVWKDGSSGTVTLTGGITGTGNLILTNGSTTTGAITLSGSDVNNAGSITVVSAAGTGATTISAVIGTSVTSVTQNSPSSALVLSAANTYTGPTTVNFGKLLVNGSIGSGAVTVASGATLGGTGTIGGAVTQASGASITPGLSVGTLTLSSNLILAGGGSLVFEITNAANADKLIVGGNLTPSGLTTISLPNTTPLTNGDYILLEVTGTLGGSAANFSVSSPNPTKVYTIVYQAGSPNKVVLNVADGAVTLNWVGDGGGNVWDIGTANWTNVSFGGALTAFANSNAVTFDSLGGANLAVNITPTVQPGLVTVNASGDYTFSGAGKISGTTALTKSGSGALTVSTANDYSGGTTISAGTVKLGANNVLGTGLVTMSGSGMKLSSDSGTARSLTNNLSVGSAVLGDLVNNGTLTLGGVVDLSAGATQFITNHSRVVITGSLTNSVTTGFALRKFGAGDLVIAGNSTLVTPGTGNLEFVKEGSLVVDGAALKCVTGFFQLVGNAPNSVARIVVTNGGSLTVTNNTLSNWRVGVNAQGGDPTATNIFEIAGVVKGINSSYDANANQLFMGAGGTIALANLWPGGELTVRGVRPSDSTAAINSEFNFRGGTLKAFTNDTTFISGLTNCFVGTGGGTIDSDGFDITIPQPLVDGAAAGYGSGGLTKAGAGTLTLTGANTYTGGTTVSNGILNVVNTTGSGTGSGAVTVRSGAALGANGSISGTVTVQSGGGVGGQGILNGAVVVNSGGTLSPGNFDIGLLSINNTLTLAAGSLTAMEINKDTGTNDSVVGLTSVSYNGTLTVTNLGATTNILGDTYQLFSAAGFTGSFASNSLPALAGGLAWNWNPANGTITVVAAAANPPVFLPPVKLGSNLILSGTNGTAGGSYYVLTSTNVALPRTNWTAIATNTFGPGGVFSFTNAINPALSEFFILQLP